MEHQNWGGCSRERTAFAAMDGCSLARSFCISSSSARRLGVTEGIGPAVSRVAWERGWLLDGRTDTERKGPRQ